VRTSHLLCVTLAVSCAFGSGTAADDPPPVSAGITESVEVRLVTVEVVALDGKDRTVADLTKEDFKLFVDRKERPIDTFDVACEGGSLDDPKSKRFGGWETPPNLAAGTRRVVFAFDYLHLPSTPCPDASASRDGRTRILSQPTCMYHTQSLRDYQAMLAAKTEVHDEELMVVALTGGLRVEQPFTRDRTAVVATLRRMEHDITLWNGRFDHLNEISLFAGLEALVTVLRAVPGPKAVVLITAGGGPSEFYQLYFERLAAVASDARVAIYPVDCRGIFGTPVGLPGGPPGLWRLASTTGGRVIANTNDPTIGYARARRDLGCRYTLGFYDRKPEEDKRHELRVDSLRADVHLLSTDRYSFPSNKERLKLAVEAAYLVPQMFEGGGLRAYVFPLQPQDASTWDALVDLDFPVPLAGKSLDRSVRDFGVVLQRGADVVHTFHRSITLQSARPGEGKSDRRITFLEPAAMPPGHYVVTAVLSDPATDKPFSYRTELSVPEIPKGKTFLTGPILGRRSGDDVVVYGRTSDRGAAADRVGNPASFRPLLVNEANREQPLAALTHACVLKAHRKDGPWVAARTLLAEDGSIAGTLPEIPIAWDGKGASSCRRIFDELPVATLRLGRYTFRATLSGVGAGLSPMETSEIPFALIATPAAQP
jgi:VWFA-related protein